jgi:metal-responsive CopG/Arc/MetJ family transcriptional regulator
VSGPSGPSPSEATRRARGHRTVVSIRLPQATLAALDARCAELGVSRSEYVAEMLAVALSQRS